MKKTDNSFTLLFKSGMYKMTVSVSFNMFSLGARTQTEAKTIKKRYVGNAVPRSCFLFWTFLTCSCDASITTAVFALVQCYFLDIARPVSVSINQIYSDVSPVIISDALAGHLHQVQVRARDEVNSDSQWSEWSPLLLVRPWEGQIYNPQIIHFQIKGQVAFF